MEIQVLKPKRGESNGSFIYNLCDVIMDLDDELTALKKWKLSKELSSGNPITLNTDRSN